MVDTLKRTFQKFLADEMPDHAAALTYFAMLSLFPALLVTATLLGLLGDQTLVTKAVDYARSNGAPSEVVDALRSSLQGVVDAAGGALSAALVFSLAIALYGAAGVFGGAGRALNKVHAVKETRPFFRHKAWDLGWTLVAIVLAIIALVSVFLGGGIAGDLFGTIGLGDTAAAIWRIARWFVAIAAVAVCFFVCVLPRGAVVVAGRLPASLREGSNRHRARFWRPRCPPAALVQVRPSETHEHASLGV
jgi:membrane protein